MIYICSKCLFTFKRKDEPDHCPNCGSINIREAAEEEKSKLKDNTKGGETQ
ncbi:hypothetical protein EDD70_1946 [Hydrogenoanaerobacterium saccharovorans]|uniref:Rubredoxin-like domain-containing protein n=1 Tax=Hydrogenoanaerobacterium saccharovorans TaxID=474960 RepID=A0A1H7YR74_9FIRM|nr:hypothetical protein [Hydrogenoanaerobacterium saccharovorans]RPF49108.1 hypothetical protein EDD70_1946 [Hydrogenoanaerobacterium saccharovorans]SEM47699.1 hypothetical protein SAMN05216180_0149 [Hydrogenoanaerobacterium saccharovorans]